MISLSKKERRALAYLREQQGLPPAKPWEHTREMRARRDAVAMWRDLVDFCRQHRIDLEQLRGMLDTNTR
jgi:hypothetical protein